MEHLKYPAIGRFLQVDPDPGNVMNPITVISKYSYVGNSPTTNLDPTGKSFFDDILNFGHNLIANFGSTFDSLIKDNGIQISVFILIVVFAPKVAASMASAIGLDAILNGVNAWYSGNQSLESFAFGANNVLNNPDRLRKDALAGLIGFAVQGLNSYFSILSEKDFNLFKFTGFYLNSLSTIFKGNKLSAYDQFFWLGSLPVIFIYFDTGYIPL